MVQKYTSKDTSINTVSAVYKKLNFNRRDKILDYGGGKYDTNKNYVKEKYDADVLVYDPYNRNEEHNLKVLHYFMRNPASIVICSNVLNVIQEDSVILDILRNIYSLMSKRGKLYIKVYERDKSGIGCETTKGWQRNQKIETYIPFVQMIFSNQCEIKKKSDILEVTKL